MAGSGTVIPRDDCQLTSHEWSESLHASNVHSSRGLFVGTEDAILSAISMLSRKTTGPENAELFLGQRAFGCETIDYKIQRTVVSLSGETSWLSGSPLYSKRRNPPADWRAAITEFDQIYGRLAHDDDANYEIVTKVQGTASRSFIEGICNHVFGALACRNRHPRVSHSPLISILQEFYIERHLE